VPALKLKGKNLIIYAAYKRHIGIYPSPKIIKDFKDELKTYETSRGAIRFPLKNDLPIHLIEKIIRVYLKEIRR
jgi:uncharacterized protein YdhG (YjbR/CyaY superfamily)